MPIRARGKKWHFLAMGVVAGFGDGTDSTIRAFKNRCGAFLKVPMTGLHCLEITPTIFDQL